MTDINMLNSKDKPVTDDLVPIYDSESGRTRNTSIGGVADRTGDEINPITDVSSTDDDITFKYYNGKEDTVKLLSDATDERITEAQSTADEALDGVKNFSGVPLNGGVWAAGQTFTAYNQYMIYNGTPYAPLASTSLPYGPVGATPDIAFVGPYPLNDHSKLSNRNAPDAHSPTATGSTTPRTLDDRFSDVVNVVDYGAVGDGVTNDAPAIQLALNTGRTVYFPKPTVFYRISETLIPTNTQTLIGEDKWADWYLAADQAKSIKGDAGVTVISTLLPQYSYPSNRPAAADFRRGITLQNLHIQSQDAPCLKWHYGSNFTYRDCAFRSDNSEAISMRQSPRGVVENCFIGASNHAGYAFTMYDNCNAVSVKGSHYSTAGSIGGVLDISKCQSVQVEGGVYEINGLDCIRVGGLSLANAGFTDEVGNCSGITLKGLYFERCNEPISAGKETAVLGLTITGCFTSNYGSDPVRSCISLGAAQGVVVEGNSFIKQDNTQPTIRFYQLASSPFRVPTKVTFSNNHTQLSTDSQDSGLVYDFDASYPIGLSGFTFGSSYMDFTQSADIAQGVPVNFEIFGESRNLIQPLTSNSSFLTGYDVTTVGGLIEKVEVIGASGTLDSTLRIGRSGNSGANLIVDLSTLTYTSGYANVTLDNQLLSPNESLVIQNVAGTASGTCSIRITYRK